MFISNRKAFSMVELVFVIVVIGILASVAIPKFAVTRDDAEITKAKGVLASVRSSLATLRQQRILSGNFTPITELGDANNAFGPTILEYPVPSCSVQGCWERTDALHYKFHHPVSGTADFNLTNGRLICENNNCDFLEN
jgi:general secretion pathway protein G